MIRWSYPFICKLNMPTSSKFCHVNMLRRIATTSIFMQAERDAAKAKLSREKLEKLNYNIGTIGHIDHGKTTLTAAITKVLSQKGLADYVEFNKIDKAKEEQKRGITINIAHVGYESPSVKRRYAHTDCPGHRDYIKNMITGASQMDAAVLVIAADDGVMAQSREHISLAKQVGVEHIIVFINKVDKVDQDTVDLVEMETRELLTSFGFDGENTTVIKGSALSVLQGNETECIDKLVEAMDRLPEPERLEDQSFLMPISSRVILPKNKSVVLIGTVEAGSIKRGETAEVKGYGKRYKVNVQSMQIFHQQASMVKAGDHCGIQCKGLTDEDVIHKGMWMGKPGSIVTSNFVKIQFYLMSEEECPKLKAIKSGYQDMIYCGLWNQVAKLTAILMPGEHTTAYMFIQNEVTVKPKAHFVLRQSHNREIGHGTITQIYQPLTFDNKKFKLSDEEVRGFIKKAKASTKNE